MASESTTVDLNGIPSSVSGDGTTFVKGLKRYLRSYGSVVDEKISEIGEGSVNQVSNVTLEEEHATSSSGNVNNIKVTFSAAGIDDYSFAQIWVRSVKTGTGFTDEVWGLVGNTSGLTYLIENVTAGYTYQVKVVACNSNAGYATFSEAPIANIDIVGQSLLCNAPTQFYWDNTDKKWYWTGYVDNGYTDFFELRTDQNAGVWSEHRLDSIPTSQYIEGKGYYSTTEPPSRSGTAYLYVRNVFGQYNTPISHQYAVTAPNKPATPSLVSTLDGVVITFETLPTGCLNYVVDVDGSEFEVFTSQWTYFKFSGSITVKYCFVDSIGRSEWSESASIDIKTALTADEIPAITREKLEEAVQNTLKLADDQPSINETINGNISSLESRTTTAEGNIQTNASAISANANSISSLVTRVTTAEGTITKQGTSITQNANSISSVASRVTTAEGNITKNASAITQNANSISSVASRVTTAEGNITKNASAITQNANSISSVVTALNETDPSKSSYSSITQLNNAIQLKVNTTDYTGNNIVGKINSASITITGDKVAIDADHVNISGAVIAEGNIKANAVTAAKIASNAVTADKINAKAVTAAKIAADAIQIGGTNNNVTIADGAINGSKITAASIVGDKIAANTITASKLKAETITLSGGLGFVGGAVTLNSSGLNCALTNGSNVVFNQDGMSFVDSVGKTFSQIARFVAGTCADNETVSLNWDVVPKAVLIFPYIVQTMVQGYTSNNLYVKAYYESLEASGFKVRVYTAIGAGTYNQCTYNSIDDVQITRRNDYNSSSPITYYSSYVTVSGNQAGETQIDISGNVNVVLSAWATDIGVKYKVYAEIYQNNALLTSYQVGEHYNWRNVGGGWTYNINETYDLSKTVTITSGATIKYRLRFELYALYDLDRSGPSATFYAKMSTNSVVAKVTEETVLSHGTAHYLALG